MSHSIQQDMLHRLEAHGVQIIRTTKNSIYVWDEYWIPESKRTMLESFRLTSMKQMWNFLGY